MFTCQRTGSPSCIKVMALWNSWEKRMQTMPLKLWTWSKCMGSPSESIRFVVCYTVCVVHEHLFRYIYRISSKSPKNPFSRLLRLQGRPAIGLFTDLSQRHVASACHTRGRNMRAIVCHRDMSHEFKLIWIYAKSRCRIASKHTVHVTLGDLSLGCVAATSRGDRSLHVTGPYRSENSYLLLSVCLIHFHWSKTSHLSVRSMFHIEHSVRIMDRKVIINKQIDIWLE